MKNKTLINSNFYKNNNQRFKEEIRSKNSNKNHLFYKLIKTFFCLIIMEFKIKKIFIKKKQM